MQPVLIQAQKYTEMGKGMGKYSNELSQDDFTFPNVSVAECNKPKYTPFTKSSYERFFNTKNLLSNKYHEFILSLDNKDVLENFNALLKAQNITEDEFGKLLKRIEKWNNLEAPIPLMYIEFIGLRTISIETTAKADMKAFKDAMKQVSYPECFFVNTASGIIRVGLPSGTPEKDAIRIAINYKHDEPIKARYICIKELKTIVIEKDNSYYTLTYPPILSLRKNLFIPGQMGSNCHGLDLP
jgi:hypothetical protein